MGRAKVYRNIDLQSSFAGLEPGDWVVLGGIGWFLLQFHGELGIDTLVMAVVYLGIRVGKRGKASNYTLDLLRYSFSRKAFLSAGAPDTVGRKNTFNKGKEDD